MNNNNTNLPNSKKLAASYSAKNETLNAINNSTNNPTTPVIAEKTGSAITNKESNPSIVKEKLDTQTDTKHHDEKIGTQIS